MTTTAPCSVCDAGPQHAVELDGGATYCPIHRGPWGAPPIVVEPAAPIVVEPPMSEAVTVLPLTHVAEDVADIATVEPADAATPPAVVGGEGAPKRRPKRTPKDVDATAPAEGAPSPTNEDGPNIPALKLLIGLILGAGVNSLDKDNNPLEPPTGFLPPPADQVPEVAGACALAVALMIRTFGIEHTDVMALARQFLDTDNEGEQE